MDHSGGYEDVAQAWLAERGDPRQRSAAIGVKEVRAWAETLQPGCSVLDVGCGPGVPLTTVLVEEGLQVHGVDGSPTFVTAFRQNLPGIPVACASALRFDFFNRTFDAILAVGLIFLMTPEDQARLIRTLAKVLSPNGRLLFTAPAPPCTWADAMTGMHSTSLGAVEYRRHLEAAGVSIDTEFEDTGQNHYYDCRKRSSLRGDT